ncbi:DUF4372 domain-containing protein [Maridesulfovibrio sp.]|uniref:DUF4372 domain-containing protein n=1 Tax=Maridesulfovibrio sp. TaxID=2795000 RepID=UPI0038B3E5E0
MKNKGEFGRTYSDTILSQLLQLIPRHVFEAVEREHPSARKARVFTRWAQFVIWP